MPTTESGWPVLPVDSPLIRRVFIPDGDKRPTVIALRWGTPAFLLGHLSLVFDERVEDINGPVMDDWGYAFRPVRGYANSWSDHSGGIAADLNATKHPLGTLTFDKVKVAKIDKILKHYAGCIYWGGNYHNRKDQMHFGLAKDLRTCNRVAVRLLDSKRGKIICDANPGLRAYVLS